VGTATEASCTAALMAIRPIASAARVVGGVAAAGVVPSNGRRRAACPGDLRGAPRSNADFAIGLHAPFPVDGLHAKTASPFIHSFDGQQMPVMLAPQLATRPPQSSHLMPGRASGLRSKHSKPSRGLGWLQGGRTDVKWTQWTKSGTATANRLQGLRSSTSDSCVPVPFAK